MTRGGVLSSARQTCRLRAICAAGVAILWIAGAYGASVSPDEARLAVENWLAAGDTLGCELGAVAGEPVAYDGEGGAGSFYVVPLVRNDGARDGFVITAADTKMPPVIAFSGEGEFVESDDNPLWTLLAHDVARSAEAIAAQESGCRLLAKAAGGTTEDIFGRNEEKWAGLLAQRAGAKTRLLAAATPSDVRVDTLVTTRWNQSNSTRGGYCYNYYTPNHYPCGCVATAFAQLLYYHKQPTGAVTTRWNCSGADGSGGTWSLAQGTKLGPWAWGAMADTPTSDAQCKAVGQLTWDLGRLCNMSYGRSSSGADLLTARRRLTEEIGYASSQAYLKTGGIDVAALKKAAIPSLDAKLPVLLGIFNSSGGHAVVGDGYGYSGGDFYMHINMGWGSSYDAWYQPPAIQDYTAINQLIYNICPEGIPYPVVVSGRVFDRSGSVVSGLMVTATRVSDGVAFSASSDRKGIYALKLPADATYTIAAEADGIFGSRTIPVGHCVSVYIKADGMQVSDGEGYGWSDWQTGQGERNASANEYDVNLTINALYPPTCSPASGTVFDADDAAVTLSCASPGATIRYTLDGSDPTESSAVYSGAISLGTGAFTLKARAFKSGCEPSEIMTAEFTHPPKVSAPDLSPTSALVEGTTTFLTRRFTFTLGCDMDGATIRYTLDGSDPTEGSPVYDGTIEIECAVGESRTVKVRAFKDGYRPSTVLSQTFTRQEPESWIDERPETHEGTGWWWPERTDFASDGRLHFAGDYSYHPNRQSDERVVTIDTTMTFGAPDESDSLLPGDDAKAALRIGPNGGFQVFTRLLGGRRVWQDVTAAGVAAEAGRPYTIRFRLDCLSRAYTAAIVAAGGAEVPLRSESGSRFRFANGTAGSVTELTYEGVGEVGAILGTCADGAIAPPGTLNVILK